MPAQRYRKSVVSTVFSRKNATCSTLGQEPESGKDDVGISGTATVATLARWTSADCRYRQYGSNLMQRSQEGSKGNSFRRRPRDMVEIG